MHVLFLIYNTFRKKTIGPHVTPSLSRADRNH